MLEKLKEILAKGAQTAFHIDALIPRVNREHEEAYTVRAHLVKIFFQGGIAHIGDGHQFFSVYINDALMAVPFCFTNHFYSPLLRK